MGDDGIRVVFRVESVHQERVITDPILDGFGDLREHLLCLIHEDLV